MERSGISQTGVPSRTAMVAACGRGAHLLTHGPNAVLQDWLAWPLVGRDAEAITARARSDFGDVAPLLATWVAARSRFAEDWLARSGARTYLILGAGLDSFAWRQTSDVRVVEVDHPATQAWKRSRLEALGIRDPGGLRWLPVDFELESMAAALAGADLGSDGIFVSWLGVVGYLSLDAIETALGGLPPCSLAVSYGTPGDTWPEAIRGPSEAFRRIAVEAGEPPMTRFIPESIAELLAHHGFNLIADVSSVDVERCYGQPALSIGNERIALARSDSQR
jgi:methyltransferase (TIGR00027 family)